MRLALIIFLIFVTFGEAMEPRINVITLGVKNIATSRRFYEELGWVASASSNEHFVAFHSHGTVLCLFPEASLAEDAKTEGSCQGFRGVTLAYNVKDKRDVQILLDQAEKAGGKIAKHAQDVFWGGHSGYFADPDGHLWEIAWNPHWTLNENGMLELPRQ